MDPWWLIEPFAEWNATTVVAWYTGTLLAAAVIYVLHHLLGIEFTTDEDLENIPIGSAIVLVVVVAPIAEELLFRGVFFAFGTGTLGALIGTGLWTLAHGKRALIIVPFGVLYLKLWLSGFWIEAIVLHMVHNAVILSIWALTKERDDDFTWDGEETKTPASELTRFRFERGEKSEAMYATGQVVHYTKI